MTAPFKRLVSETHRRSVWQVLGVYLVGAWAGWQVILEITDRVGLPDWVPAFALVLFIIGLPIVLATAIVQEGSPLNRNEAAPPQIEPLDLTLMPIEPQGETATPEASEPPKKALSIDYGKHHWIFTNQPDSALVYYEKSLSHPGWGAGNLAWNKARSHERLAELYDERGHREKAAYHAAQFVNLWDKADPDLQARVRAKRAILQQLSPDK